MLQICSYRWFCHYTILWSITCWWVTWCADVKSGSEDSMGSKPLLCVQFGYLSEGIYLDLTAHYVTVVHQNLWSSLICYGNLMTEDSFGFFSPLTTAMRNSYYDQKVKYRFFLYRVNSFTLLYTDYHSNTTEYINFIRKIIRNAWN